MANFDEPSDQLGDPQELLLAYLDAYRDALPRKLDGLGDEQLFGSELPSGWTPLQLLHHLGFVEQRWLHWGFAAEPVAEPWGDCDPATGRWTVAGLTADEVRAGYLARCALSRQIVAGHDLDEVAATGGRFSAGRPPPTLGWILFHLLQEYARHVGQLDVARELLDGSVGE